MPLFLAAGFAASPALAARLPDDASLCQPGALGTSRVLTVGTEGGLEIGFKTYPRTLALADHEVVLTFDDGPSTRTTPAVLDALAQQCVKATFFLIGRNAEASTELARRLVLEGHTVGHHSFSHPAATLRRMSTEAAEGDIERGFEADDLATYGTAPHVPLVPFFRYPGFAYAPAVNAWLARRNVAIFGADLWASDWERLTPEAELALVMERLERSRGGIVLLHDSQPSTARMMPAFLDALKAGGFHIVHLVPGPGRSQTRDAPKGWTSETDRIIADLTPHMHRHEHVATTHWTRRRSRHARLFGEPVFHGSMFREPRLKRRLYRRHHRFG